MGIYLKHCQRCNLDYDLNMVSCVKCGYEFQRQDIIFFDPQIQQPINPVPSANVNLQAKKTSKKPVGIFVGVLLFLIILARFASNDSSDSSSSENIASMETTVETQETQSTDTKYANIPKDKEAEVESAIQGGIDKMEEQNNVLVQAANDEKEAKAKAESIQEENEKSEEEYKQSCRTDITYKQVLRNPEEYIGEKVCIDLKISSVHEENLLNGFQKYYFAFDKSDYGWYGNYYGVFDTRYNKDDFKILADDVIRVWGEVTEPEQTISYIKQSEEVYCINMRYAELLEE